MFKVFMGMRFYARRPRTDVVECVFKTLEEAKEYGKNAYLSEKEHVEDAIDWVDILDLSTGEFVASCGGCYGDDGEDYPLWWEEESVSGH